MTITGAVLCTCGPEIAKHIDVDQVAAGLRDEVATVVIPRACAAEGKKRAVAWIRDNAIQSLVLAACPPRLVSRTLANVCSESGLSRTQCAVVDWREGCAWPHAGQRQAATAKAIDLVRMGIAQVAGTAPVVTAPYPVVPRVIVIGGGVAGTTAARELAERQVPVTLVERADRLGGQARRVSANGYASAYQELERVASDHPFIELKLGTRVESVQRGGGNFMVAITDGDAAEIQVSAGAVIVATGAVEMRPPDFYRYDGRRVLTVQEFESQVAANALPSPIVYVLCTGSRNADVPYCSRVCCRSALDQALRVQRAHPETQLTLAYREFYLPDAGDRLVREAQRAGIQFVRYSAGALTVHADRITVGDPATRQEREIPYERLVLAVPYGPDPDAGHLARTLSIARDEFGFSVEPHWRLPPAQVAEPGVFICGAAHGPVDFDTAVMQGMVAAQRAAHLVAQGARTTPAWSATVDVGVCTGCAQCVQACPPAAIYLAPEGTGTGVRARIDPVRCVACGNCLVACPSKAIGMPQSSDRQLLAQIDAALTPHGAATTRTLIFACGWSGFAAMELAGARRMQYPANARVIALPCSARLDVRHILYALLTGAERVTLALCAPGECHMGNGNARAEERVEVLRTQLAHWGLEPERLQVARIRGDDAAGWVRIVQAAEAPANESAVRRLA